MIDVIQKETDFWEHVNPESDELHIVFAYGEGCGPCAQTKPLYEMVANYFNRLTSNIKFHKMNMWDPDNKEFSRAMGIEAVPTFWAYYKGERVWMNKGSMGIDRQREAIQTVIEEIKTTHGVTL